MSFKDEWTLESALQVLQHPTVDSQLWGEAVEWLLKYGPPSIQKILLEASHTATALEFPELQPSHYTDDGLPVYDTARLADILGISEKEVQEIIARKGLEEEVFDSFSTASRTVH